MSNSYKKIVVNGERKKEHRHVVEKNIGRPLKKTEHIHHLNGNKLDNSLENLKIVTQEEHSQFHPNKSSKRRMVIREFNIRKDQDEFLRSQPISDAETVRRALDLYLQKIQAQKASASASASKTEGRGR